MRGGQIKEFPRIAELSPGGSYVLLHAGPWGNDTLIWDWKRGAQGVMWVESRIGEAAFIDESHVAMWFTPSNRGEHDDYFSIVHFVGANGVTSLRTLVPSQDTKGRLEMEAWEENGQIRAGLWGEYGCASYDSSACNRIAGDRYENLWPFPEDSVRYFTGSMRNGWLALRARSEVLVFQSRDQGPDFSHIDDFCAASCDEGVASIENCGCDSRQIFLRFTPFEPREESCTYSLQWLKEGNWFPWALWISRDGRELAVAAQESEDSNTVGSHFGRTVVLMYRNPGWESEGKTLDILYQVPLEIPPQTSPWVSRLLSVDPQQNVLVYWRQDTGVAFRYALPNAERLASLHLGEKAAISTDGRYAAGADSARRNAIIYDVGSGEPVNVISNANEITRLIFTTDDQIAIGSAEETRICDVASAELKRMIPGSLIPKAIHPRLNRYVGYLPDETGSGGNDFLADTKSGRPIAILGLSGSKHFYCAFSPDGDALMDMTGRWLACLFYRMDPSTIHELLKMPHGLKHNISEASSPLAPAAGRECPISDLILPADDPSKLREHLGERVVIEGRIEQLIPTLAGDALNLEFAGLDPTRAMGWISPRAYGKISESEGAEFIPRLVGKRVRLNGFLLLYGGKASEWKDRFQITVEDVHQIEILSEEKRVP